MSYLDSRPSVQSTEASLAGFTLIELSIVLVIIGLIVGGILVGRDLISAAAVRAQIAQIEKYQVAVNTFRGKYNNYLPGDIPSSSASSFGFAARGASAGQGDGNGLIEGNIGSGAATGILQSGEHVAFWGDLTYANGMNVNLIDGRFLNTPTTSMPAFLTLPNFGQYFPSASINSGNYIYVASVGGVNYFLVSKGLDSVLGAANISTASQSFSPAQAYSVDMKIDDGLPTTGTVTDVYMYGSALLTAPHTSSPAVSTDCYDSTATPAYAINISGNSSLNCALSFKFQ